MVKPVRRIVTGHSAEGKSQFLMDGAAPNVFGLPALPQMVITDVWVTSDAPAGNTGHEDASPAGREVVLHPPKRGTVFRIVDFPPDTEYQKVDMKELLGQISASDALDEKPRHFWFHKTDTVDYAMVLEGEIWAMMDEGESLMRPGDILIQRGTNHSWSNRTSQNCRMAFVLIDAEPGTA
jgi:mannose-6-phosphate isomerase-like protein (cupin superfamily)